MSITARRSFSPPVHRSILCVDIERFASRNRTDADRLEMRDTLFGALSKAFAVSGVAWQDSYIEDRGDGVLVLVPPEVPKSSLVTAFPEELAAILRRHNRENQPATQMRVRLAIHAGEIHFDEHGAVSAPINMAFRLLDAASLKRALSGSASELALIVSQWIYEEVVRNMSAFDPAAYQPVTIQAEKSAAWVRVFPEPHPPAQPVAGWDPRQATDPSVGRGSEPDARDFDEFYLQNFCSIRNIVNTRAQDWTLAAEVTDEAMAIAFRKWDELRDHPNPAGFVVVTARRILSRIQRQRAAKMPPIHPISLEATPGLELKAFGADPADTAVNRVALDEALRALGTDQRECFVLHEILGHPIRQIAELLNLPEGTVKTRLRAARHTLRDLLNGGLGEDGSQ